MPWCEMLRTGMSSARWLPIVGLFVVLALVPGALAHGCTSTSGIAPGDEFSAQTIPPSPSPLTIAAFALVPIVGLLAAIAIAIPSMRDTKRAEGVWQFNGTAYVWVPARK